MLPSNLESLEIRELSIIQINKPVLTNFSMPQLSLPVICEQNDIHSLATSQLQSDLCVP